MLPESQHQYRHLIETSPAPINIFDENGDSIWCNRTLLDLIGFENIEEFIGRFIFDVIHPDDSERAREELETVIDTKVSTGPIKMKLRTSYETTKYIHVSTAIGTSLGADIGQAVAIDVTGREERERQLQILDQWLQHNIRNEVTAINGFAANIRDDAMGAHSERCRANSESSQNRRQTGGPRTSAHPDSRPSTRLETRSPSTSTDSSLGRWSISGSGDRTPRYR